MKSPAVRHDHQDGGCLPNARPSNSHGKEVEPDIHTRIKIKERLHHRIQALGDRLLYIENRSLYDGGPPISSVGYLRLGDPEDLKSLLGKQGSADVEGWSWFDPDPTGMDESELERLVQYRHMRPLYIQLRVSATRREQITATIVPWRVLDRPCNKDSRWWYFGEPWCHRCNETVFWDPAIEAVPSVRDGRGFRCATCWRPMPSG